MLNLLFGLKHNDGDSILLSKKGDIRSKNYGPTFLGLLQPDSTELTKSQR